AGARRRHGDSHRDDAGGVRRRDPRGARRPRPRGGDWPQRARARRDEVQLLGLPREDAASLRGSAAFNRRRRDRQGSRVSRRPSDDHYSYTVYADPGTARTFDDRRFGGPIGALVAGTQARVLTNMVGRIHERPILDVGTGTGRAALLFARGGAYVTGVDASAQMLAIARQRAADEGLQASFRLGDAHDLDFPDRAFDVTVSLRLLMHTPKWRRCIAELCRVADRLVIVDYPSATSAALIEATARRVLHRAGMAAEPYQVFR